MTLTHFVCVKHRLRDYNSRRLLLTLPPNFDISNGGRQYRRGRCNIRRDSGYRNSVGVAAVAARRRRADRTSHLSVWRLPAFLAVYSLVPSRCHLTTRH
ncbi:hypothetical protein J6590_050410 [Homalodisca vitripennis]|nr:hypothetical protein J6590_050410 [Homalodisca vitripennis]